MKSDRPSFQFYPDDWLSNSNLRRCTHEERGIWMDILCILHDQEEYGVIRWPIADIARAIGTTTTKVKRLAEKGVMKGADSNDVVQPLIYTPRSGRRDGSPVTLIAAQKGPLWYSSRMIIDEYKRIVRGGSGETSGANNGERSGEGLGAHNGEGFGETPKGTPKPSPKGGIGEAKNTVASRDKSSVSDALGLVAPQKTEGSASHSHAMNNTQIDKVTAPETAPVLHEISSENPTKNKMKIEAHFRSESDQNLSEIPTKTASEIRQNSDRIPRSDSNEILSGKNADNAKDSALNDKGIRHESSSPNHSPKGGIGERFGASFGVGMDEAPKLHLTLHPSRARPSSPSPSSSSSSKEKEKTIQKSGEHSGHLPTESADIENQIPSSASGHQKPKAPQDDTSEPVQAVDTGSPRNIPSNTSTDGNIENIITTDHPAPKYPEGFDEFWAAYPVHNGKKPCAAVFARKRLWKSLPAILADIALRKARNRRWIDGFATNPLTYLNQELWLDDWVSSPALCVSATGSAARIGHETASPSPRSPVVRL